MLDHLIASSPYLGIFVTLAVAGLGVPIPEEIPIVAAGVLAHRGVVRWWLALPLCIAGVVTGDIGLYWIGRHWGNRALDLPLIRRVLDPGRRDRMEAAYRQRGALIVFGARHLAGVRGAAFLTAGIVRLPFWKFLLADGVAIAYGVPLNFTLAFLFSEHLHQLMTEVHRVERWIAVLALLGAAAWVAIALRRRGRRALGGEDVRRSLP
jgi:membrane protein DedA with SNARE-associated domain